MSNIMEMIQADAEKVLEQTKALESRSKSLENQISAKRLELREIEESIAEAKDKKKNMDAEVASARRSAIEAIDKRNQESEKLESLTKENYDKMTKERLEFEAKVRKFEIESKKMLDSEKEILSKFKQIRDILSA